MICTKCNSIIPDEAKFCPVCGMACNSASATPTVSEKKHTCVKCGLELEPKAKFCPICGTAATAVSLEKQPDSESLVSSMPNSVAEPVPTMSGGATGLGESAPMPQYAPPVGGFGEPAPMPQYAPPVGGFGEPAPMPQYAPNGFGTVGNMGAVSAAAAVAVPAKKKNGAKIAIIIIAAVVVLLGAAAVFFFTNKAAFLSTFMGKSGYATMIEGNSVKEIVGNIDASAISNSAKALSQFYTTSNSKYAGPLTNNILPTAYNPNGLPVTTECMFTSPITDYKSLVGTYSKILSETYGVDAVKVTANAKINLTDSAISAISDSSVSDASEVNKIIDAINGTTFTYDLATNDSSMGMYYGAEGKITVNAKVVMTDDGTCYLAFPFASGKALMIKMDTVSSVNTSSTTTAVLDLDEKEISRLIEDIIKIYLNHYEKAVTEMENGSLTINDEEISGKLITADFNGEAISAMLKDMINHIGEDKYFSTQIVDFINSNGGSITLNQYQSAFSMVASSVSVPDSAGFSIKTVINKNGDILAKSFAAGPNNDIEFTYKSSDKSFNAQLIVKEDTNKFTVNLSCVATDAKSGVAELSFQENDDGEFKITVSYSGVETVKSFNRDVTVGTYIITLNMPKGFESADEKLLTVLDGMQITISNSASADSQTIDLGVKTSAYGDVALTLTASKGSSGEILSIPTDVIDLTGAMNGNIDSDTEKKLDDFSKEITDALSNIEILKDALTDYNDPLNIGTPNPDTENNYNNNNDDDDIFGGNGITFGDGVSHAEDDFNSMDALELNTLTTEYIIRLAYISEYSDYTPELESKIYEAEDLLNEISTYQASMVASGNQGVLDVSMLRRWRKSLNRFVIVVEECEALAN